MRKFLLFCFLAFTTIPVFAQQWTLKAPMPTARVAMGAALLNTTIYIVGGSTITGATNIMEAYETTTNTWTTLAPMPTSRVELATATVNGKIYAIGGYNGTALNVVEIYDPVTNTWTTGAPMPTPRSQVCVSVINNKIYIVGGWVGQYTTLEVYDPATNTWATKTPLANGLMQNNGGVNYNNKFYVIGGKNYSGSSIYDSTHMYDPITDTWTVKTNMPLQSFSGAAALLNNKIHYFGGSPDNFADVTMFQTHFVYDPVSDTWSNGVLMPEKRAMHVAVNIGNRIYVIGGRVQGNSSPSSINEEYSEPGLAVNTVAHNSNLLFYPNPAREQLTVELPDQGNTAKHVMITDLSGKNLVHIISNEKQIAINTAAIPAGTYLLILNDGTNTTAEKLIIAH